MPDRLDDIAQRFAGRQIRALAQAITLVERHDSRVPALLRRLRDLTPSPSPSVGFTGAPGAGKSSLVDALIRVARAENRTVGVLAIDPSSPYSGGAILGDRLRMDAHILDPGVYVRSMGARGHLGGLSSTAGEAVWLLSAFGFDEVIVETVGTGQSEHEVASLVDTTVVVLTPGMGDSVQTEKAGIMEIADVYAVNKADLPGADGLARDVRTMLNMGDKHGPRAGWRPPIVLTVANPPDGSAAKLQEAINAHRAHLAETIDGRAAARERLRERAAAMVADQARAWALAQLAQDNPGSEALLAEELPSLVAQRMLADTTKWYNGHAMWEHVGAARGQPAGKGAS